MRVLLLGLLQAAGVLAYVTGVGSVVANGDRLFGEMKTTLGPVAFLLLFVVSACVTGFLVLGLPAFFFVKGRQREAVLLFFSTLGWLVVFLAVTLTVLLLR